MKLNILTLNLVMLLISLSIGSNAYSEETIVNTEETIVNSETKVEGIEGFEFLSDLKFWLFIAGCGVISILVKIVDYAIKLNGIESTQKIKILTRKWSLFNWLLWFLSASIVGCLGYLVGLFQLSAQAAVAIGLGWPSLFAQLKSKYGPETESKEDVKQQVNEIFSPHGP